MFTGFEYPVPIPDSDFSHLQTITSAQLKAILADETRKLLWFDGLKTIDPSILELFIDWDNTQVPCTLIPSVIPCHKAIHSYTESMVRNRLRKVCRILNSCGEIFLIPPGFPIPSST